MFLKTAQITQIYYGNMSVCRDEAPPGYIKSIVTKVINNITINCNNLILKYVEEDIVLSINVRFLSMQTVNNKWEPEFTGKHFKMFSTMNKQKHVFTTFCIFRYK